MGPSPLDRVAAVQAEVELILKTDFSGPALADMAAKLGHMVTDMARTGGDRGDPMREVFARVGDRWSLLLMLVLRTGRLRHAILRRLVGAVSAEGAISQRMLTLRLRGLERDGLIARSITPSVPPRVDYTLTPLGLDLLIEVERLMDWVRTHNLAIRTARAAFDAAEKA
jgi:DNA-binding HxlR family transcriptional regulator